MKPNNPYKNIDWNTAEQIKALTHIHNIPQVKKGESNSKKVDRQPFLQYPYDEHDIRFFNYANHDFGVDVTYPLEDWFVDVPEDVVASPGHEHNFFGQHFAQIGSTLPQIDRNIEGQLPWKSIDEIFDAIIEQYVYEDAGGIHVNHSSNKNWIKRRLNDYPNDFLGMEIFNGKRYLYQDAGDYRATWDSILSDGVQCFGFSNPDGFPVPPSHTDMYRPQRLYGGPLNNILLVDEFSELNCARAIRYGEFYTSLFGTELRFNNIEVINDGKQLDVSTSNAEKIVFVTDKGETSFKAKDKIIDIPDKYVYFRVEAYKDDDIICSQPVMFEKKSIVSTKKRNSAKQKLLLLNK